MPNNPSNVLVPLRDAVQPGEGVREARGFFSWEENAALSPCPCLPANSTARHHQCHPHGGWRSLTLLAPGLVPRGGVPFVGPRTISPAPGFRLSRAGLADAATSMASKWMEAGRAEQTDAFSAASHGRGTRNGRSAVTITVKDGPSQPALPRLCLGWVLWLLMRYRGGGQNTQASRAVRTGLSSPTSGISAPERLQDAELSQMQRPLFSHGRQLVPVSWRRRRPS